MHISICWQILGSEEDLKATEEQLTQQLKPYSSVKPLRNFYIVRLTSAEQRDTIIANLQAVAKASSKTIHFVVTPVIQGGRYNGWLPKDLWPQIRERTDT